MLNARFHEQEAYIVAEAGVPGAITIATNMAGRGTDIKLGGSLEMRIQHETASITDEAEKAERIEQIKADVERFRQIVLNAEDEVEIEPAKGRSRPGPRSARAACTSSAPSATRAGASTTSCAAAPAVRAIPAARSSSCRWKTI